MYHNKVYYCKYNGFIVICPSNKGKEPEDEQLCKRSNMDPTHPKKIKEAANESKYTNIALHNTRLISYPSEGIVSP